MVTITPDLTGTAKEIRRSVIEMAFRSGGPHVGSALSCVDVLTMLYCEILRLEPWEQRDIFLMSKAHAAMALYGTLAARGIIDRALLAGYGLENGSLPAHLDRFSAKGIEASAGSLGHGFNIGLGMAQGFKLQKRKRRVFILLGDGESEEGSVWEGALFASKLGLDNVTAIMDRNDLQGYGRPSEICCFEPVRAKWESFGWHAVEADGHDWDSLRSAFAMDPAGRPKIVIARTVKGKGVSFMEDQLIWHYYVVTDEHRTQALRELM